MDYVFDDNKCSTVTPTAAQQLATGRGFLGRVLLVTANGANQITIYDNNGAASGTVIGVIAANAAAGSVYEFDMPFNIGIYIPATASAAQLTVSLYS